MEKYSINIIWSDEDEAYIATIPEFPGLSAHGETAEEAIEEAKIALEGFIEVFKEDGCKLPEPQTLNDFSGQTRLRLTKSLHAKLSQEADREGVSLNTYMVQLLSENHTKYQINKRLAQIEKNTQQNKFVHVIKQTESSIRKSWIDWDPEEINLKTSLVN
jgi:predicted RNase H-like HicB family nuclease